MFFKQHKIAIGHGRSSINNSILWPVFIIIIVNGTHIGKANIDETIVLKKKQEGTYTFILKADMDGLFSKVGLLLPILLSGKAKVNIKGNILAKVHGINKIAPVEFDEEIVF